jgi:hypothetical protein
MNITLPLTWRGTVLGSLDQAPHKNPAHRGINKFKHYLFKGTFGLLKAKAASSKAALIAGK